VEITVEVLRHRPAEADRPAGVAVRVPDDRPDDRARLAEVAAAVAGTRGPAPGIRLLLVEDNALVATMYTAALRRLGEADHLPTLGVEVAGDGAAALERLLHAPPIDVVVTDVYMPVVSGITLVERIRAEPALAHTPVIVISSGGDGERARLSALGISAFLRKPVSYQDIAGAVRAILLGRTAQAQGGSAIPGGDAGRPGLTEGAGVGTMPTDATPASRR
jgi:CheY-like chemotaxis protein